MTANGDQLRPTLKLISLQLMIESESLSIGIFLGKVTLKMVKRNIHYGFCFVN